MNLKNMNLKKLIPWNWFKKEEDSISLPVKRLEPSGDPLTQLHSDIDRLFSQAFRAVGWAGTDMSQVFGDAALVSLKPQVDIAATDREYVITAEVPGLEAGDLHLELQEDTLLIRGEKRQEWEKQNAGVYRMERRYGAFERVLSLPDDAERDRLEAKLKHGVLTVTLPRKPSAKTTTRLIEVQAG
jgi:HSP20 family protein